MKKVKSKALVRSIMSQYNGAKKRIKHDCVWPNGLHIKMWMYLGSVLSLFQ